MTAVDSDLPQLLDLLMSRSAGEDWHKAGTFKDHLLGTYRVLALGVNHARSGWQAYFIRSTPTNTSI
jgi:hypothetical protein